MFGDVQSKNINFKPADHAYGLNVISPDNVEIQVLEDRLEKLIEGKNLIRNEWVKVHGKQKKRINVKYWPGIPQKLKDVKFDKSFGDMEELSDQDFYTNNGTETVKFGA